MNIATATLTTYCSPQYGILLFSASSIPPYYSFMPKFHFLGEFAKLRNVGISFVMSALWYGISRLPLHL